MRLFLIATVLSSKSLEFVEKGKFYESNALFNLSELIPALWDKTVSKNISPEIDEIGQIHFVDKEKDKG